MKLNDEIMELNDKIMKLNDVEKIFLVLFSVLYTVCLIGTALLYTYAKGTLGIDGLESPLLSIRSPSTPTGTIFFVLNLLIFVLAAAGSAGPLPRWVAVGFAVGFVPIFGGFSIIQNILLELFLTGGRMADYMINAAELLSRSL